MEIKIISKNLAKILEVVLGMNLDLFWGSFSSREFGRPCVEFLPTGAQFLQ